MFYQIRTQGPTWTMHTLNSLALPPLRETYEFSNVLTKRNFRHSVNACIPTQIEGPWPFIRFTPEQEIISFLIEVLPPGENYLLTTHISTLLDFARTPYSTTNYRIVRRRINPVTIPWQAWGSRNTFFESLHYSTEWEYLYDNLGQRQMISISGHARIRDFNPRTVRYYQANRHEVDNSEVHTLFDEPRQCETPHFAYPITTSLPFLESKFADSNTDSDSDSDSDMPGGGSRVYMEQDYITYVENVRVHPLVIVIFN